MFKVIKKIDFSLIILIILFSYICGPLFQLKSFGPGDDLAFIETFSSGSLSERLIDIFGENKTYIQRPISTFFLSLTHFFFQDNFILFMLTFFLVFCLINLIIYNTLKLLTKNNDIPKTYLILSLIPFLNSSFLQSPYLVSEYILPIFFWSISFFVLIKSIIQNKNSFYLSHFFLLMSLMCTVISFPLFVLNICFPLILWRKKLLIKNYLYKILFPIFFVFLIYICYIFLIKIFHSNIYGLSNLNYRSLLQGIYFFVTIFVEFPIMLIEAINFTNLKNAFIILFLVFLYFLILKRKNELNLINEKYNLYIVVIFLSLLSNFLIFFISGYPSVTYGYYNRMLVTSFFCLCLLLSFVLNLKKSLFLFFCKIILVFLVLNSSKIITKQIEQIEIVKNEKIIELTKKLENYQNTNNEIFLGAKLPLYLQNNFNSLEIFFLTWDLQQILKNNNLFFAKTFPISAEVMFLNAFNPAHNIFYYNDSKEFDSYIYVDDKTLVEFPTLREFKIFLKSQNNNFGEVKTNLRQKLRLKLKNLF